MRKISLIIFLIIFSAFHAQNITFSDQNLKNKILSSSPSNQVAKNLSGIFFAVDANSDNQISISEASQVSYLDVSGSNISNMLGITSFTNLTTLKCQGNNLSSSLNLSTLTNLQIFECQNNNLSSLTLANPTSVNASNNIIHTLNIPNSATNLTYLNISNNLLSTFTVDYASLVDFYADGNPMTSLNFQNAAVMDFVLNPITQLQSITFGGNYSPTSFTLNNFPNLQTINSYGLNPVNGLVLDNLPALTYASITSSTLKVTVKNINPSISSSGLNFNIKEFHLQGTSNTNNVTLKAIRADKYYFKDLTSVNSLTFDLDEDVTEVHFSNLPVIQDMKIEAYSSPNTCVDLDFSTIPSLKNLEINEIRYSSINLSNLNQLKKLTVNANSCNPSTSSINISNLAQLEEIIIGDRYLKTLIMNSLNSLKSIKLYENGSSTITMTSLPQLLSFYLSSDNGASGNIINSLDFNNLPILQSIELVQPFMNAINFNNLPNLKTFKTENPNSSVSSNIPVAYNFSNLPLLENIILNDSKVVPLTLNSLPSLKNLTLKRTYFGTSYTIQNLPVLENIIIEYPQVSGNMYVNDLLFNNLPLIKSISLKDFFYLNSLNFGNINTSLENFYLKNDVAVYGNLTSLSFNNFPQLKTLQVNRSLTNLQLTDLPQLHTLNVSSNKFSTFNVANLPALQYFTSNYNLLTTAYNINFSNLPVLKMVDVNYNNSRLKKIDLSQAPMLEELHFLANNSGNPQTLDYINLKNGNPNMLIMDTEYIKNICVDDDNERILLQSLDSSLANTIFTPYCTLSPAGSNYIVTGNATLDSNSNGCDTSDPKFPYIKMGINTGGVSSTYISNQNGAYNIQLQAGSYIITPNIENPTYYNSSPANITVNFPTQTSPLTQNFCLTPNGTHNDLEIIIIPVTAAAPGFSTQYKIVYKNKGTVPQSGTLVFNYNDNLMDYLTATVAPISQSTGVLNWNFTNLLPFETKEITVTLKLNTPTQTPALNGGDVLHYTTQITGATDETPLDNTFALHQTVVNSFDPNDKTCLEGTSITQTQVGDYVHYLIRFENTGTANAQNIVVKDVIDTSKFDIATLIPLSGSHSFITKVTDPNIVEFIFENIQLPFNNATNDGYVSFKIKTKSTLNIGDSFSNTANIYFDYNSPIVTNTYTTSVQNALATSEISADNKDIIIYPNPVKDMLNIQSKNEIIKADIYDTTGRILYSIPVKGKSINLSELSKGNYIIRLFTKDKVVIQKFIKN